MVLLVSIVEFVQFLSDFNGQKFNVFRFMNRRFFLPTLFLAVFLCGINFAHAEFKFFKTEIPVNEEIDSLIDVANDFYQNDEFDIALEYYQTIISKSEKLNYSKGLTKGYLGSSGVYFIQNKLDVSTSFLIKAKAQIYAQQNPEEMFQIAFREGLNLHTLGLYEEAIKKYKESISVSNKIADPEEKLNKQVGVYINIGDIYQLENKKDSALYYYKTAYHSTTTDFQNKFTSSVSISDLYIENGKLDSAEKYLELAEFYSKKLDSDYSNALFNQINGKYYNASGDMDNAIASYKKSLLLNEKMSRPTPILLKLLSEAYQKNGEENLANAYLKRYVEANDSLNTLRKENLKVPILLANTENANKIEKAESNTQLVVMSFGGILLLILLMIYLYARKQHKKTLNRKNENLQLKKKLNNAFEEVAELAAQNSPNFLSRFIEVYPEFYHQLTSDYPNLTTADLKLCALMKLDFSTKEIAEISFSSLRTVQNRKYKLRKKFNLETEENLNQWIQNLHVQSLVTA